MQKVRKRLAPQGPLEGQGARHVWSPSLQPPTLELHPKVVKPCSSNSSVVVSASHQAIVRRGPLVLRNAPHVRHPAGLRPHDLPAAQPGAQGLVHVLAAPASHVLVEAARRLPPGPADRHEAAAHHGDEVRGVLEPHELGVPRDVALRVRAARPLLVPGVQVEVRDRGHDQPARLLPELAEQLHVPAAVRRDVAVEEADELARGGVSAGLLGDHQAHGGLVPQHPQAAALGEALQHLPHGRPGAVIDDEDLLQDVGRGAVAETHHRLEGEVAFVCAGQDHRDLAAALLRSRRGHRRRRGGHRRPWRWKGARTWA
mmetsp:Transcript_126726/g.370327  ORF Transcript_126726/g.370327 Transcript_126726/m.370327 type:complete len:314 (+) Transcript_126726:577-1518(+)